MKALKNRKHQQGFTLIDLMIAAGLGMMVLYGIFTLHHTMLKNQVSSVNNMEVADLRYEITGLLSQVDKCTNILAGAASVAGTNLNLTPQIRGGSTYAGLRIASVRLQNITAYGADKRGASIEVRGSKLGGTAASTNFTELVHVYYSVNAANVILTCKDNVSVCSFMGGIWRGDHCDFCATLGGTTRANGTCAQNP